jgi:hypothetical protein
VRHIGVRALVVSVCLLASACTAALPIPSPTPQPTATARVSLRSVGLGNGLAVDVPVGWPLVGFGGVNRGTQRLLLAANVDVATLPTLEGNGDVDAAALRSGQASIEIESFCRLSCSGPTDETPLPLDWTKATALSQRELPAERHELAVGLRWFDRPMFVVARWADDAPAADIAALAAVARSIRAETPLPAFGEWNGWSGLGPLADIPAGSVRFVPLPSGAIIRPAYRTWDNEPFFCVREPQGILAFSWKPLVDRRCGVTFDAQTDHFTCTVDGRTFAWTRRGSYLGPEPASDMRPLTVVVRDGSVWVRYSD